MTQWRQLKAVLFMTTALGTSSAITVANDLPTALPTWYVVGIWQKERVRIAVLALNGECMSGSQFSSIATSELPHLLFVVGTGEDDKPKVELGDIANWCEMRQIALLALDIAGARAETLINDFDCMYDYWVRTPFACNDFEDVLGMLGDGSCVKRVITGIAAACGEDRVATAASAAAAQAGLTNDGSGKPGSQNVSGVLCIAAVNKSTPGQVNLIKQVSVQLRHLLAERWDFLPAMVYDPALQEDEIRISMVVVS